MRQFFILTFLFIVTTVRSAPLDGIVEIKLTMSLNAIRDFIESTRGPKNPWLNGIGRPLPHHPSEEQDISSLLPWEMVPSKDIFPFNLEDSYESSEEIDSNEDNSTKINKTESDLNTRAKRSVDPAWNWFEKKQQAGNDWQAWRALKTDYAKQWRENHEKREAAKAAVKKEKEERKLLKNRMKAEKKLFKNEIKAQYGL